MKLLNMQVTKQAYINVLMTVVFVILFAWLPTTLAQAQVKSAPPAAAPPSTTGGDRVQDGLNSISSVFPDTVVSKDSTLGDLAKRVIDVALYVSAMLAVIFAIYGGYQYIFSAGNEETAKTGRKTLLNALIGLAIIVLSYIIVQVVYRFLTNQT